MSARPSRRDVLLGYLLLPHAVPVIVVLAATAIFSIVAVQGWPGNRTMLQLLGAMLGGQLAIGAVNELVDADRDAIARPTKPIPAGLVSRRGARLVALGGIVLMIVPGFSLGVFAGLLCALGTGVGVAYSFWFKRTIWSWVPYVIALPLLPIWVWTALSTVDPGMFAIYPLGIAAVIAVQLAQSLPDVERDRQTDVTTLAVALGAGHARTLCWSAMALAALLAATLAPVLTSRPVAVWIAATVTGLFIVVNRAIWQRNPVTGALAAFPCIASAAVILGTGWTIALVG